jgi:hypothetical protein
MDIAWVMATADDVTVGDRVRYRGTHEFVVARIDENLLGRTDLVCLIEDSPERWHAYPARRSEPVERLATVP